MDRAHMNCSSRLLKNDAGLPKIQWSACLGQQEHTAQDAQKGGLLTRPALARQDAPCPRQGRSERRGEAYASVR